MLTNYIAINVYRNIILKKKKKILWIFLGPSPKAIYYVSHKKIPKKKNCIR
jgi:hypothetical protein